MKCELLADGSVAVAGRRFCYWCPPCCLAFEEGKGMDVLLNIADCQRRHLSCFSVSVMPTPPELKLATVKSLSRDGHVLLLIGDTKESNPVPDTLAQLPAGNLSS